MPARPSPRRAPRTGARPARRGWLSHALVGLGVSALGLGLAASMPVATSAAPRPPVSSSPLAPVTVPTAGASASPDPAVLAAYPGADEVAPADRLSAAITAERAAQRAEELAKNADDVARTARAATSKVRQQQLDADGVATRAEAVRLAKRALDQAVAARLAAETARLAAESQQAESAQQAAAQQQAGSQPDAAATTAPPAATGPVLDSGTGVPPVPGAVVGATFGQRGLWSRYHTGLDFRAGHGTPIRAVRAGVVAYAGNTGNWAGNHVAVQHPDGMTTMSSHMSAISVRAGQTVAAGQVIGYVGNTGRSFGAHLHFELYPVGVRYGDVYRAVDPRPWLAAAGVTTR